MGHFCGVWLWLFFRNLADRALPVRGAAPATPPAADATKKSKD